LSKKTVFHQDTKGAVMRPTLFGIKDLSLDQRVTKLADAIGVSRAEAIGHLALLSQWLSGAQQDGAILNQDAICGLSEWEGDKGVYCSALVKIGLFADAPGMRYEFTDPRTRFFKERAIKAAMARWGGIKESSIIKHDSSIIKHDSSIIEHENLSIGEHPDGGSKYPNPSIEINNLAVLRENRASLEHETSIVKHENSSMIKHDSSIAERKEERKEENKKEISLPPVPPISKEKTKEEKKEEKRGHAQNSKNSLFFGKESEVVVPEENKKPVRVFVKPTPGEVEAYANAIGFKISGSQFCDFYGSKGWVVGRSPMKDWKAAVRTWKFRHQGGLGDGFIPSGSFKQQEPVVGWAKPVPGKYANIGTRITVDGIARGVGGNS
jgi:hypothetical protein